MACDSSTEGGNIISDRRDLKTFLESLDEKAWNEALQNLLPRVHSVDRTALRIWISFFPLELWRAFRREEPRDSLFHRFKLEGNPFLRDQIDTSHRFLYGHRWWSAARKALLEQYAQVESSPEPSLEDQIRRLAKAVAERARASFEEVLAIAIVAVRTLQQVGPEEFEASADSDPPVSTPEKAADRVLKLRQRSHSKGVWGLILSGRRRYTVTFDESKPGSTFEAIDGQDLTMAAATDERDYRSLDPRCTRGPIPVECRSGSCGSCWVGVLHGESNLEAMKEFEEERLRVFGYRGSEGSASPIRLACQTICRGSVSIVIPPWNGVIGRLYSDTR